VHSASRKGVVSRDFVLLQGSEKETLKLPARHTKGTKTGKGKGTGDGEQRTKGSRDARLNHRPVRSGRKEKRGRRGKGGGCVTFAALRTFRSPAVT